MVEVVKEARTSPGGRIHGIVSEDMVIAQGGVFLLAGYETTATTLSILSQMLAKHPNIQQRIYDEICEHVESADQIGYETVNDFKYMEAAIEENLRLHPPVPRNMRECTADVTIEGMYYFSPWWIIKSHIKQWDDFLLM